MLGTSREEGRLTQPGGRGAGDSQAESCWASWDCVGAGLGPLSLSQVSQTSASGLAVLQPGRASEAKGVTQWAEGVVPPDSYVEILTPELMVWARGALGR